MAEVSDNDADGAGNPTGAGDPNGVARAGNPDGPSILISEASVSVGEMEGFSELEEISAALIERPAKAASSKAAPVEVAPAEVAPAEVAPAPAAQTASVSGDKSGGKSQRQGIPEGIRALVGAVISGRYKVEEVLAAGGMGCVFRGEHVLMHKRVAIKVLLPNTEQLPDLVQRFKREAVAGAHIDHPNVASATDFGMLDDGSFFLVLQFVRGVTLHDIIRRGPLPAMRAARIARQIASALDACHCMGIVHRDLKPRNIMVEEDRDDFVKLIDFGFAKVPMERIATIEKKASLKDLKVTGMGVIFGTPSYMAPEIAFGMDAIDERSDLYALGVIVYEMLAGAHPFDTKKPADLLRMHRAVAPPPIAERTGVDVPPAMEAVAMRLLQKSPPARYQSAAALIEAIDEVMPGALPPRSTQASYPLLSPESSQPAPSHPAASSRPQAPPPSEPSAAPARSLAAPQSGPPLSAGAAPKPGERRPREVSATPPAQRPVVPGWALPAAFLSLLVAIGVLVYGLRTGPSAGSSDAVAARGGPAAKAAPSDMTAPAATATAIAQPPPSALAAPSEKPAEPPRDASLAPLRTRMRIAADAKEWGRGADALAELADRAPQAFEDRDIARAAMTIASGVTLAGNTQESADKVFDALANKLGSTGLDILYDIVSTRGASKAAIRASEILREKPVLSRASPALRIAIELRDAPSCQERLDLLDRAKKEADTRAIAVLEILRAQPCIAGAGECCFRKNADVDDAIKQIWARVRSSPAQ